MPLVIYKRKNGKIFHYRGTVNGERLRGSTGTTKKAVAERFISQLEERHWKGDFDGPGAILRFSDAAIQYRQAQKSNRFLTMVEDYWKDTLVKDISSGAVRKAAIALYPTATGGTRNRHVIVPTQAIINHAASLDMCQPLKVERFPENYKVKTPVDWKWISAFMAAANQHLGALACFMFLTGARISEAIDLRWEDVDLSKRRAIIRQTKVGDERNAHLPPVLVAAIANIEGERVKDEKVFKYSTRNTCAPQWAKACKRAKIPFLSFHCCRHGFATALLHKGVDPITVAKIGGWKSAQHVFETYGHAMSDDTLANLITDTPVTQDTIAKLDYDKKTIG
jgi:integrase